MALEVIGAGFGRTGTLSLKAALEQLGYNKCHHMTEVFPDRKQLDDWLDVSQGGAADWDTMFEGYEASVDFPSSAYWRELADHFPDAKIILTTRSFESWYASAEKTIYPVSANIKGWLLAIPKFRKIRDMTYGTIWDRLFPKGFEDKAAAAQVFETHEADVKAAFSEERLLVFHPKDGWGPLCAFLGKPVPDAPFPHLNDTNQFKKLIRGLRIMMALPWVAGGVLVACLAAYLAFQ